MSQPFPSFLVFGKVFNFSGNIISNAQLTIKTSISTISKFTDDNGLFLYDLAEAGYVVGETVTVNVTEPFNNEIQTQTYIVTGSFLEENITTELRTVAKGITDYPIKAVLHSVGIKPITLENPLSVSAETKLNEPAQVNTYNGNNRLETETITVNGIQYRRTFTYIGNNFQFISRSAWQKI